jgi:hypothetical protein
MTQRPRMSLRRRYLALVGLGCVVAGFSGGAGPLIAVIYEVQGKCDYLPCIKAWTLPALSAFGVLACAGGVLAAWSLGPWNVPDDPARESAADRD